MPSYNLSTRSRIADIRAGLRVDKATIAIAAVSTKSVFTVTGGNILMLGLVGEVTTIIQAQANAVKFVSTPTVGSATDLCATVDINGLEAGGLLSVAGAAATALTKANAGSVLWAITPIVVAPGTIGFNTAADNTGNIKFSIWYVPLEDGAYVSAA